MLYRDIGKTGRSAGIIGLGCEHLDGKPYETVKSVIDAALDGGINIMDVFMPGLEVRQNIARALGERRGDVMIQGHIGSTDIRRQYDISRDLPTITRYFEDMLRLFGYIDFGMMFFIDSEKDYKGVFETGFAEYVQKLKTNGDIRHIGFSSHNPDIASRVIATGLPEMMMFSINMAFDMYPTDADVLDTLESGFDAGALRGVDPKRAALYTLCEQKGIGITVMKTFGSGKLLSAQHTPFASAMTAAQCIHYALTRPAVSSVLLGCQSPREIESALQYLTVTDEQRDYTPLLGTMRNDFAGNCVYCSHCQPCPVEIDIATVNKYLDIARLDKSAVPPSIRSHYRELAHTGAECIECAGCESRCPFGVPIIKNMAEADELLA